MPFVYSPALLNPRLQVNLLETPTNNINLVSAVGAWNKGNWVQIDAVTARRVIGLIICCTQGTGGRQYRFDIGIGNLGVEVVLVPDISFDCDNVDQQTSGPYRIEVDIPPNMRLTARTADLAGNNNFDISVTQEQLV